ncbi:hypothetical protein [Larsenimonas rhizosphaerae]|jgi:hypothetical protein|uniref:hypothetical protein n=1 Tax=Larsenimonas rhizosphaerae TaxID=2944682 RepID=UPI0020337093|nr:hypothetical protein [Larsenimonas rhizosphaerae]MCM2130042.1 hypothetical protein [Larsenimonas rhizosphaerae]
MIDQAADYRKIELWCFNGYSCCSQLCQQLLKMGGTIPAIRQGFPHFGRVYQKLYTTI